MIKLILILPFFLYVFCGKPQNQKTQQHCYQYTVDTNLTSFVWRLSSGYFIDPKTDNMIRFNDTLPRNLKFHPGVKYYDDKYEYCDGFGYGWGYLVYDTRRIIQIKHFPYPRTLELRSWPKYSGFIEMYFSEIIVNSTFDIKQDTLYLQSKLGQIKLTKGTEPITRN